MFAKQKGNFYEVWVRDANNLCGRKRDVSLESKVPTLVVNSIDILNHPSCLNSVNQDLTHDGILEVHIDGVNVFDSIEYKYFGAVEWTQVHGAQGPGVEDQEQSQGNIENSYIV